jgi:RNA polymerase sigma factor (sigma-70 family)
MPQSELIPHLFRTEFRKITSVLCKHYGLAHVEMAEDIASDTFLTAVETWSYKGTPENPVAWLYTVAKNKAFNYVKRSQLLQQKVTQPDQVIFSETEVDWSDQNINDSQLQMLFALCHPSISAEAQIGLSLRILCGFGIDEIANAFLSNRETINKRLFRAREKLRQEKVIMEVPNETEISQRLETVLTTLYLLFNEGYYSESRDEILREDLCLEAMRLTNLLQENRATNQPKVSALLALMCFHSSRFEARKNEQGEMILYNEQDESKWNDELIAKGVYFLHLASQGDQLSRYHLEAGIAYWHTVKTDSIEKWDSILQLYNKLLMTEYSPIAALNRTYALAKVKGREVALVEAEKLNLSTNPFYFSLLGELYSGVDDGSAKVNFKKAHELARTKGDREQLQKRIDKLSSKP